MATKGEEEQKLLDGEEVTTTTKKSDGTRVFKKASPNGKITVYVGKRDFVDHVTSVDPIDGVVLIEPDYFNKEGKKDRKVFAQVAATVRYGPEDVEDIVGCYQKRDLMDERMQVYPPPDNTEPQMVTLLQVRLMKKLGRNAYPFTFALMPGLPSSVSLQPTTQRPTDKPFGIDFTLKCYVAQNRLDKVEKRNSVRLAIKKVPHTPENHTRRPTQEASRDFLLSSHPLIMEANLEKGTYYHGETLKVNVAITNTSKKTVKRIKVQVRQFASLDIYSLSETKNIVAQIESEEGFPINPGGSIQRSYEVTPLLKNNRGKHGLAVDGQIKHEDTCLASSTVLPPGTEQTKELRIKMAIMVHYNVKVRCVVSMGSDLTLQLPFTLTHPKPKPVISKMFQLPSRPTEDTSDSTPTQEESSPDEELAKEDQAAAALLVVLPEPPPSLASIHDAIDHNLLNFDMNDDEEEEFVFEEFVRLRVKGLDESNETEA